MDKFDFRYLARVVTGLKSGRGCWERGGEGYSIVNSCCLPLGVILDELDGSDSIRVVYCVGGVYMSARRVRVVY